MSEPNNFLHIIIVPTCCFASPFDGAFLGFIDFYQVDCDLADDSEICCGIAIAQAAFVLSKTDIQYPM